MGKPLSRRYYVSGNVQGVGYRYFAQRLARDLGIRGWARNLDDGRVEVLAQGTPHHLESFEAELRVGPNFADVRRVEVVTDDAPVRVDGFHIR